jgi:hypothetical protein
MSFAYGQTFNAPLMTFNSRTGGAGKYILKGTGKWSDDGVSLVIRNLDVGDLRHVAKPYGISDIGGSVLDDVGQEALETAIKGKLKQSGGSALKGALTDMLASSDDAVRATAMKIVKNLDDVGIADDVLGASFRTLIDVGIKPVAKKTVGESVVAGTGKTLGELSEEAGSNPIVIKNILRGSDESAGVLKTISANTGALGKVAVFGVGIATLIHPPIGAAIIGRIFDSIGAVLDETGDQVPQCPSVGETCTSNATLPAGCVCSDPDNDGEGVVEQQGFILNGEGYLMLGLVALVGIGIVSVLA